VKQQIMSDILGDSYNLDYVEQVSKEVKNKDVLGCQLLQE